MRKIGIVLLILLAGFTLKMIREAAQKERNKAAIQRIIDARNQGVRIAPQRFQKSQPGTGARARWEAQRSR
ncbi:MAG: hypothetical protein QNJ90_08135 [Planctomycetota bacterium]|nr:hypothetical protein [Planctomycetota bacterium]